jgi:hypothetical protein
LLRFVDVGVLFPERFVVRKFPFRAGIFTVERAKRELFGVLPFEAEG